MEIYAKDEINFHSFLNAMRRLTDVTLEQTCEGLCSVSMMKRIEKGERLPEKQMRDRILSRMGVSSEGYEDYLSAEEYEQWSLRQKIIACIEEKNVVDGRKYLECYRNIEERQIKNAVNAQYCEVMELMLLQLENAPLREQAVVAERAVKLTMPQIDIGVVESSLLSEQELNLLTEYVWLREYSGSCEDEFEWRCKQYKDILNYIEKSHLDKSCRAMVYPKAVYYLCETILHKARTEENIKLGIKLCHQAVEVLRDSAKLYFFVEIVEVLEKLTNELNRILKDLDKRGEKEKLWTEFAEMQNWRTIIVELYEQHDVNPYMTDFCYMYREEESYCIGDVIRIRRKMFGMTKEQLCEGICSVKTLTRIENKKTKTQMPIVRALFERLGLCAEYIRARVITTDYETLRLAERCVQCENGYKLIEWERCLEELERKLCLDIPQNKQFVMHSRIFLKLRKKQMPKDELEKKLIEVLGYTIPLEFLVRQGEKFLSREECAYIRNIVVFSATDSDSPYMSIIREICEQYEQKDDVRVYIRNYEFLTAGLIGCLGNIGEYDVSNKMSAKLTNRSLASRRAGILARTLYNNLWNERQQAGCLLMREGHCEKVLKDCISLSVFNKRENLIRFFEQELRNYLDSEGNQKGSISEG